MLLFLDIDGVLHPDPPQPDQRLRSLPRLVEILRDHPQVEVVISSLWREHLSLDQLRDLFPADLRERIIDVTPIAERIDGWLPARARVRFWIGWKPQVVPTSPGSPSTTRRGSSLSTGTGWSSVFSAMG